MAWIPCPSTGQLKPDVLTAVKCRLSSRGSFLPEPSVTLSSDPPSFHGPPWACEERTLLNGNSFSVSVRGFCLPE